MDSDWPMAPCDDQFQHLSTRSRKAQRPLLKKTRKQKPKAQPKPKGSVKPRRQKPEAQPKPKKTAQPKPKGQVKPRRHLRAPESNVDELIIVEASNPSQTLSLGVIPTYKRRIRVGTDCSGLETAVATLEDMGFAVDHIFASELDPQTREIIKHNFRPQKLYIDMTLRNNTCTRVDDEYNLDLYIAGYPCQPFSAAGSNQGIDDEKGRGILFLHGLQWIEVHTPKVFVIENVENIARQHADVFVCMIELLQNIGGSTYLVSWNIMNTKQIGVPQNRSRIYVVGIRRDCSVKPFTWPSPVELLDLDKFLDARRVTHNSTPNKERHQQARTPN